MRDMVISDDYRHMTIRALALHAQRTGKVFASPSTWSRLSRERGWLRPRRRLYPAKPKEGIRARKPNDYWHIDLSWAVNQLKKLNSVSGWLVLAGGLVACNGTARRSSACPEGGVNGGLADGCGGESPSPPACTEARVEGELSGPSSMPHRPLWADGKGLHAAYVDRQRGIVRDTLSAETGQELASEADQPCPISCGLRAMGRSPQDDMAISFAWISQGVSSEGTLLLASDGTKTIWQQTWVGQYSTMGLGWDGEGFTASLLDDLSWDWAAARFTPQGDMLAEAELFGQAAVNYGEYDVETDPESGTTVFVGASPIGAVVSGRYGRDTSLTAPSPYWAFNGGNDPQWAWTPAVALHGATALIAWADMDQGILAREVSLPSGQASDPWVITTDQGNIVKHVAAARVGDHWVVVGQDYRGLVLAEIGPQGVQQRRLLSHALAACAATNSCPSNSSDWRWRAESMSVVAYGDSAWVGLVDMSFQRVENDLTLFTYRILPLREGCEYESLASP